MTVPAWFRQVSEVPGYTPNLPITVDRSALRGANLQAKPSTTRWRLYEHELEWPDLHTRGETTSSSIAKQHVQDVFATDEEDDTKRSQDLQTICEALHLPGTAADYRDVFEQVVSLVSRRRGNTDPKLVDAAIQMCWTFADFLAAAPEALDDEYIPRKPFHGLGDDDYKEPVRKDDGLRHEYAFTWLSEVLIREGHFADLARLKAKLDGPGWTWPALARADDNIAQLHDQLA